LPLRSEPISAITTVAEEEVADGMLGHELIYLVGLYCLVSTTLNDFNVPVPARE
jgi:hypothetical protein